MLVASVVVHDLWAWFLVEERLAGILLAAGAGARPLEAIIALLFVAYRLLCLPLAIAVSATLVAVGLGELWRRITTFRAARTR